MLSQKQQQHDAAASTTTTTTTTLRSHSPGSVLARPDHQHVHRRRVAAHRGWLLLSLPESETCAGGTADQGHGNYWMDVSAAI
jgi:hypothetical protein